MTNKHNKRGLSRLLSMFNLGCGVSVESRDDGGFLHDKADIFDSRGPHGSWTAFLCGTVWTTHGHLDDSSSLQYVHPQTGEATAHHVTASDGHKPLAPRATCSPADVALEGS